MKLALMSLLFLSLTCAAGAETHKAHVHGEGKLTIAFDSETAAEVDLDIPADSIYGFEHKARTEKEKAAQEDASRKLRDNVATLVGFDPGSKCEFKIIKIGVENEAEAHQDFNVSYKVSCASAVTGTKAQIHLLGLFPRIHKLKVAVLTNAGQTASEVTNELQWISL